MLARRVLSESTSHVRTAGFVISGKGRVLKYLFNADCWMMVSIGDSPEGYISCLTQFPIFEIPVHEEVFVRYITSG